MDEGRKRTLGIMAAILAARNLATMDAKPNSPREVSIIHDAIIHAEKIMKRIDSEWPSPT